MTKIVQLTATNIQRLYAVDITPDSPLVKICGKNGEGKSSVLDSICSAIGGKAYVNDVPIRQGAESAEVVIRLDNGVTIRRTFTESGTYLKVTGAPNGKSGQAALDDLLGKLGFDPLAFMRMEARQQAQTLRDLLGLDFTEHDADRKRLYDERTIVNRRLDEMRAAVATLPHYPDAPDAEVSSADVLAKIEAAQKHNSQQVTLSAAQTQARAALVQANSAIATTRATIAALEKQLATAKATLATQQSASAAAEHAVCKAQEAVAHFEPMDTTDLKAQLAGAEETNRQVRANAQRAAAIAEGQAKKAHADELTDSIIHLDEQKDATLESTAFPVPGLSFADDQVTYNGLPFSMASTAEQQRVSVAIGAAMNPKLKVIIIREGSLLDKRSLASLHEMAVEKDYQIWLERVTNGEESADGTSIVIEDGRVKGAPVTSEPAVVALVTVAAATKPAKKRAPAVVATGPAEVPAGAPF